MKDAVGERSDTYNVNPFPRKCKTRLPALSCVRGGRYSLRNTSGSTTLQRMPESKGHEKPSMAALHLQGSLIPPPIVWHLPKEPNDGRGNKGSLTFLECRGSQVVVAAERRNAFLVLDFALRRNPELKRWLRTDMQLCPLLIV
jgi:hypothetical protein